MALRGCTQLGWPWAPFHTLDNTTVSHIFFGTAVTFSSVQLTSGLQICESQDVVVQAWLVSVWIQLSISF